MSYEWGTVVLPAALFDEQVQVDSLNQIYQWNATSSVWVRCPELQLQEVRSASIYANGMSTVVSPFVHRQKMLSNNWDVAFDRTFVSVENVEDPSVVYGRIAHVDMTELLAWLPTVVPTGGGTYGANFRIRVLQVVDPRRKPDRVFGWNAMYGSMRGRKAYRDGKGRQDLGLPESCGYDPKFATAYPTSSAPEIQLVSLFCGQTPPVAEPYAIWFPRSRTDLTVMPVNNSARLMPVYTDRKCWNTVSQTWNNITSDQWDTADGAVPNPACFAVGDDFTNMEVGKLKTYMCGTDFIKFRRVAVVVYHLVDAADHTNHAFYVKPLGISSMAADIQVPLLPWELMAVSMYDGDGGNARFVKVKNVQNRLPNDGWRWSIHEAVPHFCRRSGANNWKLSTDRIPQEIKYYIRNSTTGVASPYFPGSVEIARRRYNMAMGFLEKRG